MIRMEFDVLSKLKLKLPKNIKVPDFIYYNLDSDYPFVGYEMIQGKFLSKELFYEMEDDKKEQFLENMNDNDTIEIIIFGKPKMVEVISTGDSHRKDQERF